MKHGVTVFFAKSYFAQATECTIMGDGECVRASSVASLSASCGSTAYFFIFDTEARLGLPNALRGRHLSLATLNARLSSGQLKASPIVHGNSFSVSPQRVF